MPDVYVGLGEVVKSAKAISFAVRTRSVIWVTERLFGNLKSFGFGSAEHVYTEITVTDRQGPSLPTVVVGSVVYVISPLCTVRRFLVIVQTKRDVAILNYFSLVPVLALSDIMEWMKRWAQK